MAHVHHHGNSDEHPDLEIPAPLRRSLALAMVPVVTAVAVGLLLLWPSGAGPDLGPLFGGGGDLVKGQVEATVSDVCLGSPEDSADRCVQIDVRLTEGPDRGEVITLETGGGAGGPSVDVGDSLLLGSDGDRGGGPQYYFADFDRDLPILLLAVLFVLAAVVFGRWSGVRALAALLAGLLVLIWFVIPSVLRGESPIAVALVGSAVVLLAVLYVTGGFSTRTTVTVLATMASLGLIAALAWIFVTTSKLTGLADEEAVFLQAAAGTINLQGLLLGGIIIGSLGVLDDMTVTQVAAVWELRRANERYTFGQLYRSAERIGRHHIASTINTLVLAYAGASLPLLIYFTQSDLQLRHILTSEIIAVEIIRTLVGSIGLIASVPITTALAAFVASKAGVPPETESPAPA